MCGLEDADFQCHVCTQKGQLLESCIASNESEYRAVETNRFKQVQRSNELCLEIVQRFTEIAIFSSINFIYLQVFFIIGFITISIGNNVSQSLIYKPHKPVAETFPSHLSHSNPKLQFLVCNDREILFTKHQQLSLK